MSQAIIKLFETQMLLRDLGSSRNSKGGDTQSDCLFFELKGQLSNPLHQLEDAPPVRFHFATIQGMLVINLVSGQKITPNLNHCFSIMSSDVIWLRSHTAHGHWYGLWYWEIL